MVQEIMNVNDQNVRLGNNLVVMRGLKPGIFDLVYIDPPFYTRKEWKDFSDKRFKTLKEYVTNMKEVFAEIHRLLKKTGTFFIHCDYHVSHYLKVACDDVFGYDNFRNEIAWCYSGGGIPERDFPRKHDVILRYVKDVNSSYFFDPPMRPIRGNGWHGDGTRYDNENGKTPENDWWTDIPPLHSRSKEKVYSTQKPVALLERIVVSSSKKGDVVADVFCGSGTTLVAAKKNHRKWFGIDDNPEAVRIARERLASTFPEARLTDFMPSC